MKKNRYIRSYILESINPDLESTFFTQEHQNNNLDRIFDSIDYNQESIAKHLKLSRSHFQNILYGKVQLTLKVSYKLAKLCNITIEELYNIENRLGLL